MVFKMNSKPIIAGTKSHKKAVEDLYRTPAKHKSSETHFHDKEGKVDYRGYDKGDLFLRGKTKDKEGNIKDIQWARTPKTKVDPDAPGTPGEPGYEPPVKREDLDEAGKKRWDELRAKKKKK